MQRSAWKIVLPPSVPVPSVAKLVLPLWVEECCSKLLSDGGEMLSREEWRAPSEIYEKLRTIMSEKAKVRTMACAHSVKKL